MKSPAQIDQDIADRFKANPSNFVEIPHIGNDDDFRAAVQACDKLLTVKGNDYVQGATGDYGRLKNFYTGAEALSLTPFQVLAVYFKKHIDAIFTFLGKGRVESEPIEGRIHDAVNYLLLMYKMVAYEKRKAIPGYEALESTK